MPDGARLEPSLKRPGGLGDNLLVTIPICAGEVCVPGGNPSLERL
jgi:hypothetical protein